ncbi:MAG TPA: hypothetical protein VHP36_03565 [Chitinispirillaceae bacterium]|nr:hypothetical protein [Chitinispirillaceae bacterium]
MTKNISALIIGASFTALYAAGPQVNFNGYLDADVWADFTGKYYVNSELDLGMSLEFNEKVSSHVFATVNSANNNNVAGRIPAGVGNSSDRWLDLKFDGFDLTYTSTFGTFSVGDLVYQYGKFNYYFYKRLSMITSEGFTRGIKYSIGNDKVSQELTAGISDAGETIADIQGATNLTLAENHSIGLNYGIQNDSKMSFSTGSKIFAGLEYKGKFTDLLCLKTDVGYTSIAGDERKNVITLLIEPSFSFGKFTTAMTAYAMIDPDSANSLADAPLFGINDEFFFYMEPGYSFTDNFAVGLPLEIHGLDIENKDDNAFWAVPTFYIYPTENVQWWLWGQVVVPMKGATKDNLCYGIGSEIIVSF